MDEISIREKFKIDDSHSKIRGIVCAYDENNNLIFERENMIVKSGRQYIMKNGINSDSFVGCFISSEDTMVTEGDTLIESDKRLTAPASSSLDSSLDVDVSDPGRTDYISNFENFTIDTNSNATIGSTTKELDDESNYFSYSIDRSNLVIRCLAVFNDKTPIKANSLGLIVNDGGTDTLFSRVTFPTYFKSENQRLTFKYYIYF